MDISQSRSCIIWHSAPSLTPCLLAYSDFPPTTQAIPSHLPQLVLLPPLIYSSCFTEPGWSRLPTVLNCYLYAEDIRTLLLNFWIANHLLEQHPQISLRRCQVILSETEAVIFPHQTCQRKGVTSSFKILQDLESGCLSCVPCPITWREIHPIVQAGHLVPHLPSPSSSVS